MSDDNFKLIKNETVVPDGKIHGDIKVEPKLFLNHDGCVIDENTYVTVDEYTQYDEYYFDILLHKENDIIPLGRYIKESKLILTAYKDKKILIYYADFDPVNGGLNRIVKVVNLYNIDDDMFYNLTEEEALKLFDESIDSSHLYTPEGKLVEFSVDKKQRVLSSGINRFSYYGD